MPRDDYQERKQARIERLQQRAENADVEANAAYEESKRMADVIPFGQPILVGHHSERRDRNYRRKIQNKQTKSCELSAKSKQLAERAEAAETNTAVSSDDPEAIQILKDKLGHEKQIHEENKSANRKLRKAKIGKDEISSDRLKEAGIEIARIRHYLLNLRQIGCMYGDYAKIPGYELTNRNANIKRIAGRIAELESIEAKEDKTFERDGFEIRHNTEVNRVQLIFPGKPSEQIRTILKQNGFRWSRYESAWQRLLNRQGESAARYVANKIEAESTPPIYYHCSSCGAKHSLVTGDHLETRTGIICPDCE